MRYAAMGYHTNQQVVLGIDGADQQVALALSPEGATVKGVSPRPDALVLSEHEMVRLLFGPGVPSHTIRLPEHARFLDVLLPLDFYLWPNETV